MGLMVGLFIPLFVGCPVILTSPEAFIRKPARWMQLLAKHQAPFSAAPNFAFDLAVARRRTAAISAPQGLDYVAGFLGALCAGWTPVPLPEPLGSLRDKRTGLAVLDCAADVVLTTSQAETRVRATIATHGASVTTLVIALDTLDEPSGDNCDLDSQLSDWSSYLQYTSGSTANPRGVVLSMRNVTETSARRPHGENSYG